MTSAAPRLALALGGVLALAWAQSDGCGYDPVEPKQEGEPCTRSSECDVGLTCRGGVCMSEDDERDAGTRDAGLRDAGLRDAGGDEPDGGPDDGGAGLDAAVATDAGGLDAELPSDGSAPDAGGPGDGG
ncbi:MAG TPA: hypothetical protein RMH99_20525 [Sandaracinaceae bacterium LLY-WYZ-13_1]|nr:hypothetical protein [Sandaracinaceae bacterium LLY-WYZ-13_1]